MTPGSTPLSASEVKSLPTHVHTYGHAVEFGTWQDGNPGVGDNHTGIWTPAGGPTLNYDGGAFYAAKDCAGPGNRRIVWGWSRTKWGCQR
jgi:hypothetical protein